MAAWAHRNSCLQDCSVDFWEKKRNSELFSSLRRDSTRPSQNKRMWKRVLSLRCEWIKTSLALKSGIKLKYGNSSNVNIKGKFHSVLNCLVKYSGPSVPWSSCKKPDVIPNPGSSSHGEEGKMKEIKVLDAREVILVCSLPSSCDATGKGRKMPFWGEIGKSKVTGFPMAANHPSGFIGIYSFLFPTGIFMEKKRRNFFFSVQSYVKAAPF